MGNNNTFKTSVYLINCMPTPILRNKSLFECLFHQPPDYIFLLTFRYLYFPSLRPYNAHNLEYRSTSYVFLGYSSSHLDYHCMTCPLIIFTSLVMSVFINNIFLFLSLIKSLPPIILCLHLHSLPTFLSFLPNTKLLKPTNLPYLPFNFLITTCICVS